MKKIKTTKFSVRFDSWYICIFSIKELVKTGQKIVCNIKWEVKNKSEFVILNKQIAMLAVNLLPIHKQVADFQPTNS